MNYGILTFSIAIDFDAAPKLPSGMMAGIGSYLGDFDQCLAIRNPSSNRYEGQYCIIKPLLPLPERNDPIMMDRDNFSVEQNEKIIKFYSRYNIDRYLRKNPIMKFVEIMRSFKGRLTNFAICLPDSCRAEQMEIAFNKCKPLFFIDSSFDCLTNIFYLNSSLLSYHRNPFGDSRAIMLDPKQNQRL